ncbi:MAG: phosphatidylcholine/phosphatidylserine synthase [Simkaniaceae bacterium]|nr:phosphatidylcholine/phosphatidylserine synthase [Simkaniaceae bacterium]
MNRKLPVIRQVNLVPNFITAFGLACGLFIIFKTIMTDANSRLYELLNASVLILILAAFADFLDGTIARAMKAESEFGFMFDTLADAITFGVVPSVLFLKSVKTFAEEGEFVFFSIICAMIFSMCGVLRLVRFNVLSMGKKKSKQEEVALKKSFIGLPIPAAAMCSVSVLFFLNSPFSREFFAFDVRTRTIIIGCWMVLIGYLMICRWKFPSLKSLHIGVPSFFVMFLTVIAAIFLLYGVLYYLPIMLVCVSFLYLIVGLCLSITRFIKARKLFGSGRK